jgi:hypothetical protein
VTKRPTSAAIWTGSKIEHARVNCRGVAGPRN